MLERDPLVELARASDIYNIKYMKRMILIGFTVLLTMVAAHAQGIAALPPKIGYAELSALLDGSPKAPLLLDVRTAEEYRAGHIPGAALSPYDELAKSFREPDKGRPIVVYCRSGRRSAIAKETLAGMGYTNISDFGGLSNWKGPLEKGD
jgi:rhodanese-related sulfurtransferase